MVDKKQNTSGSKMHTTILSMIGIILIIIGAAISFIHKSLRGSGLGSISIVLGVLLLITSILRFIL